MKKIHHSTLTVFDAENNELIGKARHEALTEFKTTGTMLNAYFEQLGGDWEDPEDPSTWGPESQNSVNWDGFS